MLNSVLGIVSDVEYGPGSLTSATIESPAPNAFPPDNPVDVALIPPLPAIARFALKIFEPFSEITLPAQP